MRTVNVLYIHGMGGGGDSRIPSILKEHFDSCVLPSGGVSPAEGLACVAGDSGVASADEENVADVSGVASADGENVADVSGVASAGEENVAGCGSADSREVRVNVVVRTYDFDPDVAQGQIAAWVQELRPGLVIGESLGAVQALRVRGMPHIFVSPSLNAPIYLGLFAFLALIPGVTALMDWIYRPKPGDRQPLHFTYKTLHHYLAHRREALSQLPDSYFAFFGKHDHYRRSGVVSVRTWRRLFGAGTYAEYDGTHFMEEEFIHSLLIPKIQEIINC